MSLDNNGSGENAIKGNPTKRKDQRVLLLILTFLGPIMIFISEIIMLLAYGTLDLALWTTYILYAFIIIAVFGLLILLSGIIQFLKGTKKNKPIIPSRSFKTFGVIGILIPSILLGFIGIVPNIDAGNKAPQLLMTDNNGANNIPDMAVTFWTKVPTKNTVKFGLASSNLDNTLSESIARKSHAFVLTDLIPSTTYFYQINEKGQIYNFTTPRGGIDEFKFAVSSDCHFGAGTNNVTATVNILENALNNGNEAMFALGDFVEYGFQDSYWKEAIDTMSPVTSSIPFGPVVGNHDVWFGGIQKWGNYMYPKEAQPQSGSQFYHRIDIGNVHIFLLDLEWDTDTYSAAQKAWFESEIAKIPDDDWTIVMNHAMYYTSGIYIAGRSWWDIPDMIKTFEPIFLEHDVDMVFTGHNHHLEALNVSGVFYGIVGGFGGKLDPVRDRNGTGSLWYTNQYHGFAEIDISGDYATITYKTDLNTILSTYTIRR